MTDYEDFSQDLEKLVEKYQREATSLKVEFDIENDVIKIFGEKITALGRAKNGIAEVRELAYTTAEHHPYWNVLYNASEIISTLLTKWDDEVSKKELEEIDWALKEITQTLEKIKQNPRNS